jgi:hypothetical protein
MQKTFIPINFNPPTSFNCANFHFRVLEEKLAALDFEAVMSSQSRLQGIFGVNSQWPKHDMTLAENIKSLSIHKQEFESREAFAYSIFNCLEDKCLGSVYIDPSQSANYDCDVYLWIRNDNIALDAVLYKTVSHWLHDDWPFAKIAFPGRGISWQQWAIELTNPA